VKVINVRFWHKADMSGFGLLPCNLTPKPHFAGQQDCNWLVIYRG